MKARCHNPNNKEFGGYGARGIQVCQRWRDSFDAFLSDMGWPPSWDHQLDRVNTDVHYEPGNVRWVTPAENAANRRRSGPAPAILACRDESRTLDEWAEHLGHPNRYTIVHRLRRGWSVEEALEFVSRKRPTTKASEKAKARAKKHIVNGEPLSVLEAAEKYGVKASRLRYLMRSGTLTQALDKEGKL